VDETGGGKRISTTVDGHRVDVWVEDSGGEPEGETEVSFRRPTLDQALDGLMSVVGALGSRLGKTDAQVITVEFGCEFAVESGSFVAIIGKATGQSSFKRRLFDRRSAGRPGRAPEDFPQARDRRLGCRRAGKGRRDRGGPQASGAYQATSGMVSLRQRAASVLHQAPEPASGIAAPNAGYLPRAAWQG